MAVIDFNLEAPNANAPRVLWRQDALAGEPGIPLDQTTWDTVAMPTLIDVALTYPIACNAVGVVGVEWAGEIVSVYFDDDLSGWQLAGTWQPTPGAPFLGIFDFQTSARWRITFSSAVTARGIKLGMALAMQRNLYGGIAPISKRVNKTPNMQLGAHFSGSQIRQTRRDSGTLTFDKLTPDWVRAYWSEFMRDHRRNSVFVAWRPDSYRHEVVYGTTDSDVSATNESGNGMMRTQFNIEGVQL